MGLSTFAKKNKAKTKKRVGQSQLNEAKSKESGNPLEKKSNKVRLEMTRAGAKNLIEGTRELNAIKRQQKAQSRN